MLQYNNVILYYVIHYNVQCYILDMIDIESILKIRIATIVRNEKCSKECLPFVFQIHIKKIFYLLYILKALNLFKSFDLIE